MQGGLHAECSDDGILCTGGFVPLKIAPSTLGEYVGRGVFAVSPIPKGTLICTYNGKVVVPYSEASEEQLSNGYCFYSATTWAIYIPISHTTTSHAIKNPAIMINDSMNHLVINTRFKVDHKNKKVSIVSTKNIKQGEELFISYGSSYWAGMEDRITPVSILNNQ